jgi:hypothetical protein
MIRKLLVVAAAAAMPISVIAATGGIATAKTPPVDATHYTVSCSGITAKASFNPVLTNAGSTPSTETTKISGSASGCVATPSTGGTPITITGVKVGGTITSPNSTHSCGSLASPTSENGNLVATWKTSPKIAVATSTLAVNQVTGGVGANGDATFVISFSSATGSFQGTDNGAGDSTDAQTTTGISAILASCGGKGLKSIGITKDTNAGAGPALSLS